MNKTAQQGIVLVILVLILTAIFWPPFTGTHHHHKTACLSNLKQLGTAMRLYAGEFDETLGRASGWNDSLFPYLKSDIHFHCPEAPKKDGKPSFGYAMNRGVAGAKIASFNSDQLANRPLFFDSTDLSASAVGDLSLLPDPGRHDGKDHLVTLDGRARIVPPSARP